MVVYIGVLPLLSYLLRYFLVRAAFAVRSVIVLGSAVNFLNSNRMPPKSKKSASKAKSAPQTNQPNPPTGGHASGGGGSSRTRGGTSKKAGDSAPLVDASAEAQPGFVMVGGKQVPAELFTAVSGNKLGFGCTICTQFTPSSLPLTDPRRFHNACPLSSGGFPKPEDVEFTTVQAWSKRADELILQALAVKTGKAPNPNPNPNLLNPNPTNSKKRVRAVEEDGSSSEESSEEDDNDTLSGDSDPEATQTLRKKRLSHGDDNSPLPASVLQAIDLGMRMHTDLTTLLTLPDMEDRVSHFKTRFAGYLSMADAATRRLVRSHVDFLKAAKALNVTWTSASTPGAKPNLAYGALTFAAVDIKAMVDCLRATNEAGKLPVGGRSTSSASGMPPGILRDDYFDGLIDMSKYSVGQTYSVGDVEYLCLKSRRFGLRLAKASAASKSQTSAQLVDVGLAARRLGIPVLVAQNLSVQDFLKALPHQVYLMQPADAIGPLSRGELPPLSGLFAKTEGLVPDRTAIVAAVNRLVDYSIATYAETEEVTAELIQLARGLLVILARENVAAIFVQAWQAAVENFNTSAHEALASVERVGRYDDRPQFRAAVTASLPVFRPMLDWAILACMSELHVSRLGQKLRPLVDKKPLRIGKFKEDGQRKKKKGDSSRDSADTPRESAAAEKEPLVRGERSERRLCHLFEKGLPCKFYSAGNCRFSHSKGGKSQ